MVDNPNLPFEQIQKLVRFHYQYVLLNDFLPRIVHSTVIADLKTNGKYEEKKLKFFHWKNLPFMPVEFSGGLLSSGSFDDPPGYRLNDEDSTLLPIFTTSDAVTRGFKDDLTGFRAMGTNKTIDWGRFIDLDVRTYDGSPRTIRSGSSLPIASTRLS